MGWYKKSLRKLFRARVDTNFSIFLLMLKNKQSIGYCKMLLILQFIVSFHGTMLALNHNQNKRSKSADHLKKKEIIVMILVKWTVVSKTIKRALFMGMFVGWLYQLFRKYLWGFLLSTWIYLLLGKICKLDKFQPIHFKILWEYLLLLLII